MLIDVNKYSYNTILQYFEIVNNLNHPHKQQQSTDAIQHD